MPGEPSLAPVSASLWGADLFSTELSQPPSDTALYLGKAKLHDRPARDAALPCT